MSLKNITYLDLIEACQEPGCPACNLRQKMVESYLRMLFHEHINDPPSRDKLPYSQGLCYEHLWLAIDRQPWQLRSSRTMCLGSCCRMWKNSARHQNAWGLSKIF